MTVSGAPGVPRPAPSEGGGASPRDALVVGFDASPPSTRAARLALELAQGGRARLFFVYAHRVDAPLAEPRTEEEVSTPLRGATKAMELLVREARQREVRAEAIAREGDPATVILQVAREVDAKMVLVGTRGLGNAARLFLGSVSSRVVSEGRVPVTVVP